MSNGKRDFMHIFTPRFFGGNGIVGARYVLYKFSSRALPSNISYTDLAVIGCHPLFAGRPCTFGQRECDANAPGKLRNSRDHTSVVVRPAWDRVDDGRAPAALVPVCTTARGGARCQRKGMQCWRGVCDAGEAVCNAREGAMPARGRAMSARLTQPNPRGGDS
jgi:hypothetical protein